MTEHTRLLGAVAPALKDLCAEVERVRNGEIAKPVREIAPVSLRVQELAMQCTRQLHGLSTSQFAAMKGGKEDLAFLAGACSQISLAATLCNLAINDRTEAIVYEDADPTPTASRARLRQAGDEMHRAATTFHGAARRLSRRLASASAQREDRHLIAQALDGRPEEPSFSPAPSPATTMPPDPALKPVACKKR
ncbi:hypothetical protein [Streptomyces sp. NPDC046860]|uniref:hypothetical protein n=1 Tax=Streptomyces sp. NPDC046860 TaxID=3154495 RepID=UPI0033D7216E